MDNQNISCHTFEPWFFLAIWGWYIERDIMNVQVSDTTVDLTRAQVVARARSLLGRSEYCYLHESCFPPGSVNCTMMVHWVYDQQGIKLPTPSKHLLADLFLAGKEVAEARAGDLVFVQYPERMGQCEVGDVTITHVGIWTDKGTVVHACGKRRTVVEDPFRIFIRDSSYIRGYVRLLK
ncbi:MAG: NlpC/P60 family protein [Candidatus Binatia bacterium]|nr:NlpC/P60 family protein [Candidatus Binatia bacterium]